MRTDDLSLLLQPKPTEPSFRQGVIKSYDLITGENTIEVAGATLTNVPFLNPGSTNLYFVDDIVVLLKYNSSWAILGRVEAPVAGGTANIGPLLSLEITGTDGNFGYAITTTPTIQASLTFTVPSYIKKIRGILTANLIGENDTAGSAVLAVQSRYTSGGPASVWQGPSTPPASFGACNFTQPVLIEDATSIGSLTAEALVYVGGTSTWSASNSNAVQLTMFVIMNSGEAS